jgi:hypothetical protein
MERDESKFVIKYASHMLPSLAAGITRHDACFYAGEGHIATVLYEGFGVDIYCDGETKIYNRNTEQYYTGGADLILNGFDTDDKFHKATEDIGDESLIMDMNSWFDLYCYGEHISAVSHMLNDAIGSAKDYVYQEYFWAETLLDMLDK